MRLMFFSLCCLILLTGCDRQMPTGIPPRQATSSEMSPFDGRWELSRSNPPYEPLPFQFITVSESGQRVAVDDPDAAASVIGGEYLNTGPHQFVDLTISVALGREQYGLVMRRPEAPGAPMSGRLSGHGIEGFQMVRVSSATAATD